MSPGAAQVTLRLGLDVEDDDDVAGDEAEHLGVEHKEVDARHAVVAKRVTGMVSQGDDVDRSIVRTLA